MTVDTPHGAAGDPLAAAWREHRAYLVAIARRTLGDAVEAEDVVQDAFARLAGASVDDLLDLRAWLAVVVRRLCFDRLRSAYARRESAVDSAAIARRLAAGGAAGPEDRVTLDDRVQLALAFVMDHLSPAERCAFVLHDVFGFPFEVIAEVQGRTPAACRQLASRARRRIRGAAASSSVDVDVPRPRVVMERFLAAAAGGDLQELLAVLDPDVVGDGRDFVTGQVVHLSGAESVARRVVRFMSGREAVLIEPVPFDEDDLSFVIVAEEFRGLIQVAVDGDRVTRLDAYLLGPHD